MVAQALQEEGDFYLSLQDRTILQIKQMLYINCMFAMHLQYFRKRYLILAEHYLVAYTVCVIYFLYMVRNKDMQSSYSISGGSC